LQQDAACKLVASPIDETVTSIRDPGFSKGSKKSAFNHRSFWSSRSCLSVSDRRCNRIIPNTISTSPSVTPQERAISGGAIPYLAIAITWLRMSKFAAVFG